MGNMLKHYILGKCGFFLPVFPPRPWCASLSVPELCLAGRICQEKNNTQTKQINHICLKVLPFQEELCSLFYFLYTHFHISPWFCIWTLADKSYQDCILFILWVFKCGSMKQSKQNWIMKNKQNGIVDDINIIHRVGVRNKIRLVLCRCLYMHRAFFPFFRCKLASGSGRKFTHSEHCTQEG